MPEPTGTSTAPPPAEATPAPVVPPATPTPPVSPTPAATIPPAPPLATPAPPATEAATIDPNTEFFVSKSDGTGEERVTLQEMADSYAQRSGVAGIDPNKVEELKEYAKAMGGDREAIKAVVDRHLSVETPVPVPDTPEGKELASIREELSELKTQVSLGQPVLTQIEEIRERSTLKTLIDANAVAVPYLVKHPQGPALLQKSLNELAVQAKALGVPNLKNQMFGNMSESRMKQIWGQTFAKLEDNLKSDAQIYQGFNPAIPAGVPAPPASPTYVDDQGVPTEVASGNSIPARYQVVNGVLTDTRSGNPAQQAAHGQLQEIPGAQIAAPPPTNSPISASVAAPNPLPAPRNHNELVAFMKGRRAENSQV